MRDSMSRSTVRLLTTTAKPDHCNASPFSLRADRKRSARIFVGCTPHFLVAQDCVWSPSDEGEKALGIGVGVFQVRYVMKNISLVLI